MTVAAAAGTGCHGPSPSERTAAAIERIEGFCGRFTSGRTIFVHGEGLSPGEERAYHAELEAVRELLELYEQDPDAELTFRGRTRSLRNLLDALARELVGCDITSSGKITEALRQ